MSTQSYPLRLPGIQAPAAPRTSLVHHFLLVTGLSSVLMPLLMAIYDLRAYQALPIAVLLGLTCERVVQVALSRRQDLFEPINLVAGYFALYFAMRATYVLGWPSVPRLGLFVYDDYIPAALWCASLGYLAFAAGYHSKVAKRIIARLPNGKLFWPRTAPAVRILFVLVAGFAAWAYLFRHGAFVVGAVSEDTGHNFHSDPMPGIPVLLGYLLDCGWVAICISVLRKQPKPNKVTIWIVAAAAVSLLTVRLVYTGGKQYLLEPLVQAMIVYHYLRRRLRLRHALFIGVPCAFLAFGALNVYRFVIISQSGGAPTSFHDLLGRVSYAWDYFTSDSADNMQQSAAEALMHRQFGVDALALVMKYTPDRRPFGWGRSYLTIPEQTFVPRQLWKDKPIYIPTDDFERDYLGVPPGGFTSMHVISDLFQNFGFFGVVAGMFLIGVVLRLLYLSCVTGPRNGLRILVYAVLAPGLVHSLEAEPVVNSVVFLRLGLLLYLVMKLLGTHAEREEGRARC